MLQRIAMLAGALAAAALISPAVMAASITVNTTTDVVNASDGACSLREAISAVNTATPSGSAAGECSAGDGNADTVVLAAGTYTLSLAGADEDGNAAGDLDVLASVVLQGAGMDQTTIDAAGFGASNDRALDIPATGLLVSLEDLAITNGHAPDASQSSTGTGEDGGAIRVQSANVSLVSVALRNNQAGAGTVDTFPLTSGNGGAIAISGGQLTVERSVVAANSCVTSGLGSDMGGGIYALATAVSISRSSIENNTVDGGSGGGIYCGSGCGLDVRQASITGNTAGAGGGIYMLGDALVIANTTLAQNVGYTFGAGAYVVQQTAQQADPRFDFVTLVANQGDGISFYSAASVAGSVLLRNSVVAGNSGDDCVMTASGSLASQGYNLLGATCAAGSNDVAASLNNLHLGPLILDDQGLTWVKLPGPTSAAINAGNCAASALNVDQRTTARPQGVPRVINKFDGCDIGAAELGDDIFWDDFEDHAGAG
ncbi:MAG TPA: CSLREA domain-containing protein [Rhodanobacteraceae bacterium]|nr:CSLREA domain-containing protein [Rhodanobacteraceae bacterium]